MPDPAATVRKVARHLGWIRSQGLSRLVEEDELSPVLELKRALRRRRWSRDHPVAPGAAKPVLLFGLQRSGTNMVARGFRNSPRFEVFNENDRRAFSDFRLLPADTVNRLIERCRAEWVLFKPLCDSHRAAELIEGVAGGAPARAFWVLRDVDSRTRSAVGKFGDANLRALRSIAAGEGDGLWQAGGLSEANRSLISSFDYSSMPPADAAALFWFVRNSLFFEMGLDRRDDVKALSYGRLVAAPQAVTRQMCEFLGCPWEPALCAHIESRLPAGAPVDMDPRIRELCDELQARFDAVLARDPAPEGA
jgi:hypothetical protein